MSSLPWPLLSASKIEITPAGVDILAFITAQLDRYLAGIEARLGIALDGELRDIAIGAFFESETVEELLLTIDIAIEGTIA